MDLSFILHPLTQWAGIAAALAAALGVLFFNASRIRALDRRIDASNEEAKRANEFLRQTMSRLETQLNEAEEQYRISAGAQTKSCVNINKRTQAIRMLRSGETRQRVAATLGMTLGELDLLVKVQEIVRQSYGAPGAGDSTNALSA